MIGLMTGRKSVLILGASRYYSRGIASARAAGYVTLACDRNPQAEGLKQADLGFPVDITDRDAVLALASEQGISGIVPVNDYGVPTAAEVADKLGLPGISPEAARLSTCKAEMRRRWSDCGIPSPTFRVAETETAIRAAIGAIGLPCILKPAYGIGGGSRGVIVVREAAEIGAAIAFSQSFYDDPRTLVERFVEVESEHSAEVLIHDGAPQVIAIGDKIKTPLPYRVDKNVLYPSLLEGTLLQRIEAEIRTAVLALGVTMGAAHVEFGMAGASPVFFELGARCGGGGTPDPIVPYVTGLDQFVETVRLHCGDPPRHLRARHRRGCNYHFLTPKPGRIAAIHGLEAVRREADILDVEVLLRPGETVRPVRSGLDRAGFIIAGAESRSLALTRGQDAERRIEFVYQ